MFCGTSNFEHTIQDSPFTKLFDAVADSGLFPGANDLVVDTNNMTLANQPKEILAFTGSDNVSHFEYFKQKRTLQFLSTYI